MIKLKLKKKYVLLKYNCLNSVACVTIYIHYRYTMMNTNDTCYKTHHDLRAVQLAPHHGKQLR